MVENCGNCAFGVKRYGHSSVYLHCHRHAPIVYIGFTGLKTTTANDGTSETEVLQGPLTVWPEVKPGEFCGDWELEDARS